MVDRLVIRPDILRRLTDSVETAASLGGGLLLINLVQEDRDLTLLPKLRLRGLRHLH